MQSPYENAEWWTRYSIRRTLFSIHSLGLFQEERGRGEVYVTVPPSVIVEKKNSPDVELCVTKCPCFKVK